MHIKHLTHYPVWVSKFGQAEVEWLSSDIETWMEKNNPDGREYEYMDNFRLSHVLEFGVPITDNHGNLITADTEYADLRDGGCCGIEDIQFGSSPAGHMYVFGFNYGH